MYDIGICTRLCYGSIKVLCIILIYVVGNVMALLKLFGVANVWQPSGNFMEINYGSSVLVLYIFYFGIFWCLFRTEMLFQSMLWFTLAVC